MNLSDLALRQGDYDRAASLAEEALAISASQGELFLAASAEANLGAVHHERSRFGEARERFLGAFALASRLGASELVAMVLDGLAAVEAAEGEQDRSATLLGASQSLLDAGTPRLQPYEDRRQRETARRVREALGEAPFEEATARGREMTPEAAIEFALRGSDYGSKAASFRDE